MQKIDIKLTEIIREIRGNKIDENYAINKIKYLFSGKYANGMTAGQHSKEIGTPTGQLGCPNCGGTLIGEFSDTICVLCNKDIFKKTKEESKKIKLCGNKERCYTPHSKSDVCNYLEENERGGETEYKCLYTGKIVEVYTTNKAYEILKKIKG